MTCSYATNSQNSNGVSDEYIGSGDDDDQYISSGNDDDSYMVDSSGSGSGTGSATSTSTTWFNVTKIKEFVERNCSTQTCFAEQLEYTSRISRELIDQSSGVLQAIVLTWFPCQTYAKVQGPLLNTGASQQNQHDLTAIMLTLLQKLDFSGRNAISFVMDVGDTILICFNNGSALSPVSSIQLQDNTNVLEKNLEKNAIARRLVDKTLFRVNI